MRGQQAADCKIAKHRDVWSHHNCLRIADGIPAENCAGRQSSQQTELPVVGLRVEQEFDWCLCLHQQGNTDRKADTLAGCM